MKENYPIGKDYQISSSIYSNWSDRLLFMSSQLKLYADRIAEEIRCRLLDSIRLKLVTEGVTLASLARQIGVSPSYLSNLLSEKQGRQLTLAKALQIWMGIGNSPLTLIADSGIDPLMAQQIYKIMRSSSDKEVFLKFMYLLAFREQIKKSDWSNLEARIEKLFLDVAEVCSFDIEPLLLNQDDQSKPTKKTD